MYNNSLYCTYVFELWLFQPCLRQLLTDSAQVGVKDSHLFEIVIFRLFV